jgi:hypothetical protein
MEPSTSAPTTPDWAVGKRCTLTVTLYDTRAPSDRGRGSLITLADLGGAANREHMVRYLVFRPRSRHWVLSAVECSLVIKDVESVPQKAKVGTGPSHVRVVKRLVGNIEDHKIAEHERVAEQDQRVQTICRNEESVPREEICLEP